MRALIGRRSWRLVIIVAALFAVAGGVAYATIPDGAGVYTACKLNVLGTIRLIDPSLPSSNFLSHCITKFETQITWNQTGQPGPQGPKGDTGAPGKDGAPGTTLTSVSQLGGLACTAGDGSAGVLSVSTSSSGDLTLHCKSSSVCTPLGHSTGVSGIDYSDCRALGTPGDASTYTQTMAAEAASAVVNNQGFWLSPSIAATDCGSSTPASDSVILTSSSTSLAIVWTFAGPNAGHVRASGTGSCPGIGDPSWN